MKKTLVVLAIVASMSSAYASGSLFGGDTNNYDNSVTNQGGKGGDGGNASALGIGVGVETPKPRQVHQQVHQQRPTILLLLGLV